jgi:hypothetical protein
MFEEAAELAFSAVAETATYTPPGIDGLPLTVSVIIDRAVERWSLGSQGASVMTSRDEVTFSRAQVAPVRGATLVVGAATYTIGDVIEHDGIHIVMAIR